MTVADQISKDRGQPATVRIGVVSGVLPLRVQVQATEVAGVGVLGWYTPVVGDVVALLGQSAVSADGSSWLCLGSVESAADLVLSAVTVTSGVDPALRSTSSATFVPISSWGVVFTAPASGRVLCHFRTATNGANSMMSPRLGTGDVIGAGTVEQAASANFAVATTTGATTVEFGATTLFTGLLPGVVYNVELQHASTSGTGNWARREVIVQPTR